MAPHPPKARDLGAGLRTVAEPRPVWPPVVCVTGADGAGKSTLVRAVVARLAAAGWSRVAAVSVWDPLREGPGRRLARRGTLDAYLRELRPTSRTLLVFHALSEALQRAVDHGAELCVADGYWYKYCATEITLGADAAVLARLAAVFPAPCCLFHLRIDPARAARRKAAFSAYETGFPAGGPSRAAFVAFQAAMGDVLRRLVMARGAVELDATAGVAELSAVVARVVAARLAGPRRRPGDRAARSQRRDPRGPLTSRC